MIPALLINCTKWHLSTFTSIFSTSVRKDVRHPECLEHSFIRHLEVAVASERKRRAASPIFEEQMLGEPR